MVADTLRLLLVYDVKAIATLPVEGYVARLLRMETRKRSQNSREALTYSGQNVHFLGTIWRRGRDLNSRMSYPISGFQDRHVRPLRHPSDLCFQAVTRLRISDGRMHGGIRPSTAAALRDGETCP